MNLAEKIEQLYIMPVDKLDRTEAVQAFNQLRIQLNRGETRAAECVNGTWKVNDWVKKGILLGFRIGRLTDQSPDELFQYFDKDTMRLKRFSIGDQVRIVPGGSAVRDGSYIGEGVIIMPPAYVNIGAYVGDQTMIDSHALVGSCAQIGKHVHLSAAAQIGGVLEPPGALPVIIEDGVLVGGGCGIYEGTIVKRRAVLAAGVILTGSTPVYDVVNKLIHRRSAEAPLVIPENAVVVPGARPLRDEWASSQGLSLYSPVIVKYRDERTDAATALEESLR